MKPLVFHSAATAELEAAVEFYGSRRRGLGRAFLAEVQRTTARIRRFSDIGAPYKETGLRHCVLRRFPYIVCYLELPEAIWIAAVAHGNRKPDYWRGRTIESTAEGGDTPASPEAEGD